MSGRTDPRGGALAGLRVLDLSWGPVGAITTMVLADHGADVIRVDRPGGDPLRRRGALHTWDRSKRSAEFDLHVADDVARVRRLAETADVLLDGMGRGRLDALGLGEHSLRGANPGLVWCAISAGEPERDEPALASDVLACALLGVMIETGGHRDGPVFPGHPAVTYATAFLAVIGILAATHSRLVRGGGDRVDVSLRDGVLALSTLEWWSERGVSFIRDKARNGRLDFGRRRLLLQHYHCSGGGILQLNTAGPGAFGRAMRVFGLDARISPAPPDAELETELIDDDLETLRSVLPQVIAERPVDHWTRELWASNVACLPIERPGEVFAQEQVRQSGLMRDVEHPVLGRISIVGTPIVMSRSPAPDPGPVDAVGGSGRDVREHGWRGGGFPTPIRDGPPSAASVPPLADVRIAELSTYFAGPYANRLLGQLGADVVKVEPLRGDPGRPLPDPCENAHGGKRSIAVDLKSPQCADVLARLIRSADVVQHNMRPGAVERIGLDETAARSIREDIIYAYAPGYGSTGPMASLQSFAPLHSGFAGLMLIAAGEGNEPVIPFGNEDYYAGLLGAIGTLLALVHRDRTGEGQAVEVAQLFSTVFTTSEYFVADGQIASTIPPLDSEQRGWSPTVRIYDCASGVLCLSAVSDRDVAAVGAVVAPGVDVDDERAFTAALAGAFAADTAGAWVRRLAERGVPCAIVREEPWLGEFLTDPASRASGASVAFEHAEHGPVCVIGDLVHLRDAPSVRRSPAPRIGEHTWAILAELGVEARTAAALVEGGHIVAAEMKQQVFTNV